MSTEYTRAMLLASAKYEVQKFRVEVDEKVVKIVVDDVIDALQANPAWARSLGIGDPRA